MALPRCPQCGSDEINVDVDGYAKFPADIVDGRIVPDLSTLIDFFADDGEPYVYCDECGYDAADARIFIPAGEEDLE